VGLRRFVVARIESSVGEGVSFDVERSSAAVIVVLLTFSTSGQK
jgi:hypothetical protein